MPLTPTNLETFARARADLRMGLPVILRGADANVIAASSETIAPDRFAELRGLAGHLVLTVTARRAATLKAPAYDGTVARLVVPPDADLGWVRAVADPVDDLRRPMKGPLVSDRGGSAALHILAVDLLKSARLLPAALVADIGDDALPALAGLTMVDARGANAVREAAQVLRPVVSARVPLAAAPHTRLSVFRPEDGGEEHYAIEIGTPSRDAPVLARLHSACFTGDLLGSLKCDCGPQLQAALAQMGAEGAGVLLYLNQEGRGIGLANKMRAYSLQDQGFDTVEANHRLGFEDDERDFRLGAAILRQMGFGAVRLMTNNPAKVDMMQRCGIDVTERVPLRVGATEENRRYLATKAAKSGHLL